MPTQVSLPCTMTSVVVARWVWPGPGRAVLVVNGAGLLVFTWRQACTPKDEGMVLHGARGGGEGCIGVMRQELSMHACSGLGSHPIPAPSNNTLLVGRLCRRHRSTRKQLLVAAQLLRNALRVCQKHVQQRPHICDLIPRCCRCVRARPRSAAR